MYRWHSAPLVYQNSCWFPFLVYLYVFVFHDSVSACVFVCLWGLMPFTSLARQYPRGNKGLAVWLTAFPRLQPPAVLACMYTHAYTHFLMLLIFFTACCFTMPYSHGFYTVQSSDTSRCNNLYVPAWQHEIYELVSSEILNIVYHHRVICRIVKLMGLVCWLVSAVLYRISRIE